MTDVAVDRVRIRGPHAQRLAGIAARALPAALDRALSDVDDASIVAVSVKLEVDVDGLDDETLAILWAEAIRARVLTAGARISRRQADPGPADASQDLAPQADAAEVLAAARAWLAVAGEQSVALPPRLLALGDNATASAVAAAAGARQWRALLTALAAALTGPQRTSAVDASLRQPAAPETIAPDPAAEQAQPSVDVAKDASLPVQATSAAAPEEPVEHGEAVLAVLAELSALVAGRSTSIEPAMVTRAAGLVLLYPWLADHCHCAQDLHPDLDPLDVREAALAAVVDPQSPTLADDPLVRLLAGHPQPWPDKPRPRRQLPRMDEVLESAIGVLASFAALLPGFERSTPGFVRSGWIARVGLVDVTRNPVLMVAATRPLDVMLARLPYPVGLLKLPWSPPVSVRFRP
jgi:hypothetical protein